MLELPKTISFSLVIILILIVPDINGAITAQPTKLQELRIAVLPLKNNASINANTARTISNLILDRFVNSRKFTIIERQELNKIQQEIASQQSGLFDPTKVTRIGKMLAANKILVGELTSTGGEFHLHLRLLDVSKASVDFSQKGQAGSIQELELVAVQSANSIIHKIQNDQGLRPYITGLIPGLSHFERGAHTWGWTYATSSVLLLGGYFNQAAKYDRAKQNQQDLIMPYLIAINSGSNAGLANSYYLNQLDDKVEGHGRRTNQYALGLGLVWLFNYIHMVYHETTLFALDDFDSGPQISFQDDFKSDESSTNQLVRLSWVVNF